MWGGFRMTYEHARFCDARDSHASTIISALLVRRTLRVQISALANKKTPTLAGVFVGGEGGIRTLGTREGTLLFESSTFNHSVTSP